MLVEDLGKADMEWSGRVMHVGDLFWFFFGGGEEGFLFLKI